MQTITAETYQAGQIYYVLSQTEPPASLPSQCCAPIAAASSTNEPALASRCTSIQNPPPRPRPTRAPLGVSNDTLGTISNSGGLILTNSTYARGIGLVGSQSTVRSGSSGGFTESLDLVDVKVNGFHLSVHSRKFRSPSIIRIRTPRTSLLPTARCLAISSRATQLLELILRTPIAPAAGSASTQRLSCLSMTCWWNCSTAPGSRCFNTPRSHSRSRARTTSVCRYTPAKRPSRCCRLEVITWWQTSNRGLRLRHHPRF